MDRTSCYRALHDINVLCTIFETTREPSDLARSARVCKVFSVPAVRVLWRQLETLSPLFRVLTTLELRPSTAAGTDVPAYWLNGVYQEDLARFQHYASYVRVVARSHDADGTRIHDSVLQQISRLIGGNPILPCVKALNWVQYSPHEQGVFLLASQSLTWLQLKFVHPIGIDSRNFEADSKDTLAMVDLLKRISRRFPVLQTLAVRKMCHQIPSLPAGAFANHLRVVALAFSEKASIVHALPALAKLRSLTDLFVFDGSKPHESQTLSFARSIMHGFPTLRLLHISSSRLIVTTLLSTISSPILQTLCIKLTRTDGVSNGPVEYETMFVFIAHRWSNTLAHLDFHFPSPATPFPPSSLLAYFYPLLAARMILKVRIAGDRIQFPRLQLSDEDVNKMAQAWPHIEVLEIGIPCLAGAPSLVGLLRLVKNCPRLCSVDLPCFIDSSLVWTMLGQDLTAVSHTLTQLDMEGVSAFLTGELLLQLLNCLKGFFPNLNIQQSFLHAKVDNQHGGLHMNAHQWIKDAVMQ